MNIKALIFDLDGTLLDTITDIMNSCNQALTSLGLSPYGVEEYKVFVGDGVDRLIERVLSHQNANPELFIETKTRYLSNYQLEQHHYTKIYDGIPELLQYATESGIKCSVLSNKPHADTEQVIHYYFPENPFALVYGKKQGFLPKPDPSLLMELMTHLNVPKAEILYIGDTLTDMITAKNAGLKSIGVLWGFRDLKELKQGSPYQIVHSPSDIIDILRR